MHATANVRSADLGISTRDREEEEDKALHCSNQQIPEGPTFPIPEWGSHFSLLNFSLNCLDSR
jgi:hypothetical protein